MQGLYKAIEKTRVLSAGLLLCLSILLVPPAQGYEFNFTPTVLSFGNFTITDPSVDQTIEVTVNDGGCSGVIPSPGITINTPPTCGAYELTDTGVVSQAFSVNVTFDDLTKASTPKEFIIDDFTTNTLVTEADGSAILYLGATLTAPAAGGVYPSGSYNGTMNIIVTF